MAINHAEISRVSSSTRLSTIILRYKKHSAQWVIDSGGKGSRKKIGLFVVARPLSRGGGLRAWPLNKQNKNTVFLNIFFYFVSNLK